MRSLRDLLIFFLCGFALIVWGLITLLSPGAAEMTDAGSPYWTIPLGLAMVAAGVALSVVTRRRRAAAAAEPRESEAAPAGAEDDPREPGSTPPPAP